MAATNTDFESQTLTQKHYAGIIIGSKFYKEREREMKNRN